MLLMDMAQNSSPSMTMMLLSLGRAPWHGVLDANNTNTDDVLLKGLLAINKLVGEGVVGKVEGAEALGGKLLNLVEQLLLDCLIEEGDLAVTLDKKKPSTTSKAALTYTL
eukprot:TRINITY_DN12531_c0_g1_i1.p2 TRINITY_DN12531_c0_g1~~TRINITY_DN12531_c0_g1_i1.p2  ORF type:complete len:110 (-),score=19.12 TRINITY_DN12531_c0_g1_i1:48-377(-)